MKKTAGNYAANYRGAFKGFFGVSATAPPCANCGTQMRFRENTYTCPKCGRKVRIEGAERTILYSGRR